MNDQNNDIIAIYMYFVIFSLDSCKYKIYDIYCTPHLYHICKNHYYINMFGLNTIGHLTKIQYNSYNK